MTTRNTLVGIDARMLRSEQPATHDHHCERAALMDLPLIWREIEAL